MIRASFVPASPVGSSAAVAVVVMWRFFLRVLQMREAGKSCAGPAGEFEKVIESFLPKENSKAYSESDVRMVYACCLLPGLLSRSLRHTVRCRFHHTSKDRTLRRT